MRIAQISPLYESVPPKLYGGTERVVSYLTEALIDEGHDVTLFASADSQTRAKLVSNVDQALRLNKMVSDPLAHHIVQMYEVMERIDEFDVLHFHTDYLHFPFTNFINTPVITTLHGRLDILDLQSVYSKFYKQNVVSISNNQRLPLPQANWRATVYHGLPHNLHRQGDGNGGYLAFLGRISVEKRVDRAIDIAKKSGFKLKIAAKIDKADQEYFETKIKKMFTEDHVEYVSEINENEKTDFLGNAKALLFPIDWPEPFGMVMIEAMACGTPVIAYGKGSVPEIIEDGKNGFIVNSIEEAVAAVKKIDSINRKTVRECFEERFSSSRMAKDYIAIYERLLTEKSTKKVLPMKGKYQTLKAVS